ncbi:DUF4465 domain-containing protein [Bacteroidales bacterium OttesenSCG-928-I14]|nr:DUF4465 domain-containing protein [Bacteroidales bacterium OttesenSCG-928-I14]
MNLKSIVLGIACVMFAVNVYAEELKVATFEDLSLEPESWWNGSSEEVGFKSGDFFFETVFSDWGGGITSWSGCAYSNVTATDFVDLATSEFNSVVGKGVEGSDNFAVVYYSEYDGPVQISLQEKANIKGVFITNTAYTAKTIREGNGFAKAFEQGDFLKIVFADEDNNKVEYFLADYMAENSEYHFVVDSWQWLDLSSLAITSKLQITMESSQVDQFGIQTPAYFCMDNLRAEKARPDAICNNLSEEKVYFSSGIIYLEKLQNDCQVNIYSSTGLLIYTESCHNNSTIDINNYPFGLYLVEIVSDNGRTVHKVKK